MTVMPEAISAETAKLLKDLTGATDLDAAVLIAVEDVLEHRLESIEDEIAELHDRYGMDFDAFQAAWEEGDIQDRHSYDVERDYWRWEELVTRRRRVEEALAWIP